MNTKLTQLYSKESCGRYGAFAVDINVGATKLPDLNLDSIRYAAGAAARLVETAIMTAIIVQDAEAQARRVADRKQLVGLFCAPVFVEEIPNGYCSDWCCKHLPWFIVTTRIGRITIGWRKRVINIDWSETTGKTSGELFPSEDVTKGERMIHAWSIEDAQRYVDAILQSAPQQELC